VPEPDSVDSKLDLPQVMSPGTLRGLGAHLWEATLDQKGDARGRFGSRFMTARLVWAELDVYDYEELVNGEVGLQERRIDRHKWRRTSAEAPWVKSLGTSGDSLILGRTTQPWSLAMQPFEELATWERLPDELVEARPVRVYRVRLGAPPALEGDVPLTPDQTQARMSRSTTPLSLEGRVYVDIETGNRLLAELDGRFVPFLSSTGHDLTDEVSIVYRERRSITPLPPDVVEPPPERVVDRTQPRQPQRRLPPGTPPVQGTR
jgi:hypothetical protein